MGLFTLQFFEQCETFSTISNSFGPSKAQIIINNIFADARAHDMVGSDMISHGNAVFIRSVTKITLKHYFIDVLFMTKQVNFCSQNFPQKMQEIWVKIDSENYRLKYDYEISNFGNVRRVKMDGSNLVF